MEDIDTQIDNIDNILGGITLSNMAAIGLMETQTQMKLDAQGLEIDSVVEATLENNAMLLATASDVETLDLELDALAEAWNQTADGLAGDIEDVAQDIQQSRNTMAAANDSLNNAIALEARTRAQKDSQIVNVMGGIQNEVRDLTAITERQEDVLERELGIEAEITNTLDEVNGVNMRLANEIDGVKRTDAAVAQSLSSQIANTNQHLGEEAHELIQTINDVKGQCLARSDEVEAKAMAKVAALEQQLLEQKQLNESRVTKIAQLENAQAARVETIERLSSDLAHTNRIVHQLVDAFEQLSATLERDDLEIDALQNRPRVIVEVDPVQQMPPPMYYGEELLEAIFQG